MVTNSHKQKKQATHIKVRDLSARDVHVPIRVGKKTLEEKESTRELLKKIGEASIAAYGQKKLTKTKTAIVLSFINSFGLTIFTAVCLKANILPLKIILGIVVLWAIVFCLLPVLIILKGWTRVARIMCGIGLVVLLLIGIFINAIDYTIQRMQLGDGEKIVYSVLVKSDNDKLKGPGYMAGSNVAFLESSDAVIAEEVLKEKIIKYSGVNYFGEMVTRENLYDLFNELINNKKGNGIICLDQSQLQLATEEIDNFSDQTKVVYTYDIEVPSSRKSSTTGDDKSFVIYLSVANQYDFTGKVEVRDSAIRDYHAFNYMRGLNEINRLIAVNAVTRKILIVDIPADYYIQIGDDVESLDRLSNAGIYGAQQSINVLDRLYGIEIDFYIRSTFDNLEEIANSAGVDINFDDAQNYPAKLDYLIGELTNLKVFLPRYDAVLMRVDKGVQTDFPVELSKNLIRTMLQEGNNWKIEYYNASGTVSEQTLYSLGTEEIKKEVVIPHNTDVEATREKLQAVLSEK